MAINHTAQAQTAMPGLQAPDGGLGELPHQVIGPLSYSFVELYGMWIFFAAGGLLVAGLAALAIYLLRKRKGKGEKAQIPPLELAVRALNSLDPPDPFVEPKKTEYFFELSMRIRLVIEEAFVFPATDLTIREIRKTFQKCPEVNGLESGPLLALLERCELIKFAKSQTDAQEARDCHHRACELIEVALNFKNQAEQITAETQQK